MALVNYPLQYDNSLVQRRLRVANFTKPGGPIGLNQWSPVAQHEYGYQLVQLIVSNPTGNGVSGTTAADIYGSLNGRDFEKLGTITIVGAAGDNRDCGHLVLTGVWPYVAFHVTSVGTAGTVVEGLAQPVAGNLN